MNELSDILSEAAADIERCVLGLRFFQEGKDTRVTWLLGYGELEEHEPADARIRYESPSPVSLYACQ